MIENPTFVIDASVVARWLLNTPPFLAEALLVRSDFQSMRISLLAPDNLRYEVRGAIHGAVAARQRRAVEGEAQVVVPALEKVVSVASDEIDDPVLFGQAPRPDVGTEVFQWFGLTDTAEGITQNCRHQVEHAQHRIAIMSDPVLEVVTKLVLKNRQSGR